MDRQMEEICALLNRINEVDDASREISMFLMINKYDGKSKVPKADVDLAIFDLQFSFDATEAKRILHHIIHEEKETHPEKAEKAAKLRHRISELEKETNKIN